MHDSPKAAHFDIYHNGVKVKRAGNKEVQTKWAIANALKANGIENMAYLTTDQIETVQGLVDDFNEKFTQVGYRVELREKPTPYDNSLN